MHSCVKCNKSTEEVFALIRVKEDDYICSQCIEEMKRRIDKSVAKKQPSIANVPSAKRLVENLNQYIIGQYDAKQALSIAVRNHFKRSRLSDDEKQDIQKSNILIIGNSGTGKTEIVKRIAEHIAVPMIVVDANRYTAAGYTGDEVESMIKSLYIKSGRNKNLTEHGIIFIDEIDKKRKDNSQGSQKDLGGEEVQKALLKIVEGTTIKVEHNTEIDTSNIMFIAGGAFTGLDKIIEQRITNKSIGFFKKTASDTIISETTNEDLFKFGMIPEFVGRFPVITHTNDLTEDELLIIAKEPKNSIYKQYIKLFEMDGVKLSIHDDIIRQIVSVVNKDKIGVRGIHKGFDSLLKEYQYNLEDYESLNIHKIEFHLDKDGEIKVKQHKKRGKKLEKKQSK